MSRLIDADKLLEELSQYNDTDEFKNEYEYGLQQRLETCIRAVEEAEPVDAVPVRHGKWETVEDWDGDEHYKCSVCGAETFCDGDPDDNDYLYCPHCGARMDGDDNG